METCPFRFFEKSDSCGRLRCFCKAIKSPHCAGGHSWPETQLVGIGNLELLKGDPK